MAGTARDTLPAWFANAEVLLYLPLPNLPTLPPAPPGIPSGGDSPRYHFEGDMAEWESFEDEVIAFSSKIAPLYERCVTSPVTMEQTIEKKSPFTPKRVKGEVGPDIVLANNFFNNCVVPVAAAIRTMTSLDHGPLYTSFGLPKQFVFGDKSIPNFKGETPKELLGIAAKLPFYEFRIVGEVKLCATVGLGDARTTAVGGGETDSLRNVIGQTVNYMVEKQMRYGFVTSYDETLFLKFSQMEIEGVQTAWINISKPLKYDETFKATTKALSTRMALTYIMSRCCSFDDKEWKIPDDAMKLTADWFYGKETKPDPSQSEASSSRAASSSQPAPSSQAASTQASSSRTTNTNRRPAPPPDVPEEKETEATPVFGTDLDGHPFIFDLPDDLELD